MRGDRKLINGERRGDEGLIWVNKDVSPVSNRPPPANNGTIESILAEVPSSKIGKRSVR